MSVEVNFDSIVGPTHNYSGLSYGNVASMIHQAEPSNPKEAALQGLEKMLALHKLGIKQAVLPPQQRPHIPTLRAIGFRGSDAEVIDQAQREAPHILNACSSAAVMWAANMATVSPSKDTEDGRVHFTPANLSSKFHRSIEAETSAEILKKIFPDPSLFAHHPPLPAGHYFSDEGAANHTRFCSKYDEAGIELFVFGRWGFKKTDPLPKKFPARQSFEASDAIVRRHLLNRDKVVFAQQNPEAIDAGVFHNDVISTGNLNLFLYHEKAFVNTEGVIEDLRTKFSKCCNKELATIKVADRDVPLQDAVSSYLFNSQIVTLPNGEMALIAPSECQETPSVKTFLNNCPIKHVYFFDLRQSMRNGGGPACLRFRVVLTPKELAAMNQSVLFTEQLYLTLQDWIKKYYKDKLVPADLGNPELYMRNSLALQELMQILNLL